MFQSAPDPKAGRESPGPGSKRHRPSVSIRSRPEGRERVGRRRLDQRHRTVSIRSRPEGRERVRHSGRPSRSIICFNPLPTRRPGESRITGSESITSWVSIRSRPEGRERVRGLPRRPVEFRVSIRSRPEGRERGCGNCWPTAAASGFNPLPTRRPGERLWVDAFLGPGHKFQSAPDPKAGREVGVCAATWSSA